jgi:hypothetical protein
MKPTRCIDWSQIVRDLEKAGMTQQDIGAACDKAHYDDGGRSWVNKLKNIDGTQPKFHEGALLLGLWADRLGRPYLDLPRTDMPERGVAGRVPAPVVEEAVAAIQATWVPLR